MQTKWVLVLIVLSSLAVQAADKPTPLNIKEGLWEVTTTHSMTGMPGMPPDALAKMSPEQRARVEEMMKQRGIGGPTTKVTKSCVTREKIDKDMAFADERQDCTRTVVSSSPSHFEMKFHCERKKASDETRFASDGTFVVDISGSDSAKGTSHIVAHSEGHDMTMDFSFTSKYLGPACGDVK